MLTYDEKCRRAEKLITSMRNFYSPRENPQTQSEASAEFYSLLEDPDIAQYASLSGAQEPNFLKSFLDGVLESPLMNNDTLIKKIFNIPGVDLSEAVAYWKFIYSIKGFNFFTYIGVMFDIPFLTFDKNFREMTDIEYLQALKKILLFSQWKVFSGELLETISDRSSIILRDKACMDALLYDENFMWSGGFDKLMNSPHAADYVLEKGIGSLIEKFENVKMSNDAILQMLQIFYRSEALVLDAESINIIFGSIKNFDRAGKELFEFLSDYAIKNNLSENLSIDTWMHVAIMIEGYEGMQSLKKIAPLFSIRERADFILRTSILGEYFSDGLSRIQSMHFKYKSLFFNEELPDYDSVVKNLFEKLDADRQDEFLKSVACAVCSKGLDVEILCDILLSEKVNRYDVLNDFIEAGYSEYKARSPFDFKRAMTILVGFFGYDKTLTALFLKNMIELSDCTNLKLLSDLSGSSILELIYTPINTVGDTIVFNLDRSDALEHLIYNSPGTPDSEMIDSLISGRSNSSLAISNECIFKIIMRADNALLNEKINSILIWAAETRQLDVISSLVERLCGQGPTARSTMIADMFTRSLNEKGQSILEVVSDTMESVWDAYVDAPRFFIGVAKYLNDENVKDAMLFVRPLCALLDGRYKDYPIREEHSAASLISMYDVDYDAKSSEGFSAFELAFANGDFNFVSCCREQDHLKDNKLFSEIMEACISGAMPFVSSMSQILPNSRNTGLMYALLRARLSDEFLVYMKMIYDQNEAIDFSYKNKYGESVSALIISVFNLLDLEGRFDVAVKIIDIFFATKESYPLLVQVIYASGRYDFLDYFGGKSNTPISEVLCLPMGEVDGETIISYALRSENVEILEYLQRHHPEVFDETILSQILPMHSASRDALRLNGVAERAIAIFIDMASEDVLEKCMDEILTFIAESKSSEIMKKLIAKMAINELTELQDEAAIGKCALSLISRKIGSQGRTLSEISFSSILHESLISEKDMAFFTDLFKHISHAPEQELVALNIASLLTQISGNLNLNIVTRHFVALGADYDMKNQQGQSALDIAVSSRNTALVEFFKNYDIQKDLSEKLFPPASDLYALPLHAAVSPHTGNAYVM